MQVGYDEQLRGRRALIVLNFRSGGYLPLASDNSHTRIIWDCAWSDEGDIFATASRDKTVSPSQHCRPRSSADHGNGKQVKIWHCNNPAIIGEWSAVATIKPEDAVTAVSFAAADWADR
jgi:elongator complex protein 2